MRPSRFLLGVIAGRALQRINSFILVAARDAKAVIK